MIAPSSETPEADRWRPWLLGGITALFVVRALYPTESAALEGDGQAMAMLWLALGLFWLLGAIGQTQATVRLGWTSAAVLLVIVLHTIAALTGMRWAPRPAVNMLWEWLAMGLAFFLARQFVRSNREVRALMAVMIATGAALSAHGLYQWAYDFPKTQANYLADPKATLRELGLPLAPGSPERIRLESRLQNREPLANFALTNSLAGYLAPWLIVGVGIAVAGGGWRVAGVAMLVGVCLLLTRSRSGYAAAAVGLLLMWLMSRHRMPNLRRLLPIVGILVVLMGVACVVGSRDGRWASRAAQSFGYRMQYWRATLGMIADHPLCGVGPGNFQNEYTRYRLPEASEEVSDPHNFLLEIAATAGIPTAIGFLALLAAFAVAAGLVPPSPSHDTPQEKEEHAGFVVAGAIGGFLLSIPLSMISTGQAEIMTLVLGLPVAVACLLIMKPWIDRGHLPNRLPAIGVVVLLIDLSASGGIGFPGIAGTLWLLMAVGLTINSADVPHPMSRKAKVTLLGVAAILLGACYLTGYAPVMYCKAHMRNAQGDPPQMEQHLLAAGADDPWDVRPWNQLAFNAFADWQRDQDDERLVQFERYAAEGIAREPHASPAWMHLADCQMMVFERTGRREHLEKAIQAYRKAVELYPNNGIYHGRLAIALQAHGDQPEYRRQADRALELDDLTPHADKKMPAELRGRLLRSNAQLE